MNELLKLWELFGEVPVNDGDEIQKSFLHFEPGTDRFEIMQWFENQNCNFAVHDKIG